jgi:hypothetical protein
MSGLPLFKNSKTSLSVWQWVRQFFVSVPSIKSSNGQELSFSASSLSTIQTFQPELLNISYFATINTMPLLWDVLYLFDKGKPAHPKQVAHINVWTVSDAQEIINLLKSHRSFNKNV